MENVCYDGKLKLKLPIDFMKWTEVYPELIDIYEQNWEKNNFEPIWFLFLYLYMELVYKGMQLL